MAYAKFNTFPRPINLGGGRAVGWLETEIDAWLHSLIKESRKDAVGY